MNLKRKKNNLSIFAKCHLCGLSVYIYIIISLMKNLHVKHVEQVFVYHVNINQKYHVYLILKKDVVFVYKYADVNYVIIYLVFL